MLRQSQTHGATRLKPEQQLYDGEKTMVKRVICPECGSECQYDDRSVWEGNREMEDFECPVCGHILARVFTDQIPNVILIKKGEKK